MEMFKRAKNLKTAFGLVKAAARAIRDEPRVYDQGDWAFKLDSDEPIQEYCDTAFCRGGMMVFLADGVVSTRTVSGAYFDMEKRATDLLGGGIAKGDSEHSDWQFQSDIVRLFNGDALNTLASPGTNEYAEEGAHGLELFAKKWESRLRKTRLLPPIKTDSNRRALNPLT